MSVESASDAPLPVEAVLADLLKALCGRGLAVLSAPPGAGKTTLVPLALLESAWLGAGRIVLVEPRRLAARAAARRMAFLLGEEVGRTVGYRMRLDSRVSRDTRIEVVTEGVFTRMALDDPELADIACVIFDEFHERALEADFGLALALDIRGALRDDLRLLVMSATLDTARLALLLGDAPVLASEGRTFPVAIRHRERPAGMPVEAAMAGAILAMLDEEPGSILAFLPGQREIERTAERLTGRLPAGVTVHPLFGALSAREQDEAIRPAPPGTRKIVLATALAETSITIDGVSIVIDSGLARRPVHEPAAGLSRLETVRVSRAAADQRAGRAGRTGPGIALRLWRAEQTAALESFDPPEILSSDLSGLLLDCLSFGVSDPATLAFLDAPPAGALVEAKTVLLRLGAIGEDDALTVKGRRMRALPLPVRLAAMVDAAEPSARIAAAELALVLTERGLGGGSIDLSERLSRFRGDRGERASAARRLARRIAGGAGENNAMPDPGALLLAAFPDRVAMARGARGRFLMANGRGAVLDETERLAGAPFLVVADLTGRAGAPRILAAAEVSRQAIGDALDPIIENREETAFDAENGSVRARRVTRLGALVLSEEALARPKGMAAAEALADGVRATGIGRLPWDKASRHLRQRLGFLCRSIGEPWPDVSDEALTARLPDWFIPFQSGVTSLSAVAHASLADGLKSLVPYSLLAELDRLAPAHFLLPTGNRAEIRYDGDQPVVAVRVQELFGLTAHPLIAGGRQPVLLELLSPAHRPIQTTRDLPGFWKGSWEDVRREMKGRYPKHVWPERPEEAAPTARAKPRAC